jgi:concentrative nucleoside transporter, CNT family
MEKLVPILGLFTIVFLAWTLSAHKKRFPVRIVLIGLCMQIFLAVIILKVPQGKIVFENIGGVFTSLLNCVDEGARFVFGSGSVVSEVVPTSNADGQITQITTTKGPAFTVHYFAFKVLPTIIFFSSLMSVLYYLGVMQVVVGAIARVMQYSLKTSGAETLSTAGNIFVGQTEAPLLVKPYLNKMTNSELMAVMVGGFATIAGGVMAAYIGMGIDAVHLLSASLMSAPAALVMAKVMQPEVDTPETLGKIQSTPKVEAANVIDAAARGASDGLQLALNVGAMLIAFLALLFMLDSLVSWATGWFGNPITFSQIMGYLSSPFAWLMGIESKDCLIAGEILGKRIVGNEFIAYASMDSAANPAFATVSPRTKTILTYALCGFASFGSIGIQIGGLGPLAPDRRDALVKLGLRAMIGGIFACYMTACIVAVLL